MNQFNSPQPSITRRYRRGVLAWLHTVRVQNRIARAEQGLLAEFGLTVAQYDVLARLATEPGISQQGLANRLLVTKGNVAGLIDRLECAGLVKREPDLDDRRVYRLCLTPEGRRIFEAAAPVLDATIASQFEGLTEDELAMLVKLLAKLDRSLGDRSE